MKLLVRNVHGSRCRALKAFLVEIDDRRGMLLRFADCGVPPEVLNDLGGLGLAGVEELADMLALGVEERPSLGQDSADERQVVQQTVGYDCDQRVVVIHWARAPDMSRHYPSTEEHITADLARR